MLPSVIPADALVRLMGPVQVRAEDGITLPDGWSASPGDIWGSDWSAGLPSGWGEPQLSASTTSGAPDVTGGNVSPGDTAQPPAGGGGNPNLNVPFGSDAGPGGGAPMLSFGPGGWGVGGGPGAFGAGEPREAMRGMRFRQGAPETPFRQRGPTPEARGDRGDRGDRGGAARGPAEGGAPIRIPLQGIRFARFADGGVYMGPEMMKEASSGYGSWNPSDQQADEEIRNLQRVMRENPVRRTPGRQFNPRPSMSTMMAQDGGMVGDESWQPERSGETGMEATAPDHYQQGGVVYPGVALDSAGLPTFAPTAAPQQQASKVAGEPAKKQDDKDKKQQPQQRTGRYEFGPDFYYTPQAFQKLIEEQTASMDKGQGYEEGGVIPKEFMQYLANGGLVKEFGPDHHLMFSLGMKYALSPNQAAKRLKSEA